MGGLTEARRHAEAVRPAAVGPLRDTIAQAILSPFEQRTWDHEFDGPLVCFCAVLAMKFTRWGELNAPVAGLRTPSSYAGDFSAHLRRRGDLPGGWQPGTSHDLQRRPRQDRPPVFTLPTYMRRASV